MITVLIADDQELIRDSLKIMISDNEIEVAATVKDGQEALYEISKNNIDVVLLDIRMPLMDGIACLKRIRNLYPALPVIMLTTFDDDEYVFETFKYKANGYLLKSVSRSELKAAIKKVYEGGSWMPSEIMNKFISLFSELAIEGNKPLLKSTFIPDSLVPNEMKIIRGIGRGLSNKEISYELSLGEGTVRNYISAILSKLNLRDRTQIAIFAVQNALVDTGDEQ
ncbi:response regulator transcription factor [uncultured Sphaerochaeta sp.]|uniref:response regulator transcription factor n=1 Tax=uncultured Sphaerochaeta sp. TaxID=886478 RepID=UPI002A0A6378|nr:response regulator transcription factor [uncultured Sphaerochaeta sp.]